MTLAPHIQLAAENLRAHLDEVAANAEVPPADVLGRSITPADVAAYPSYFIAGAGHATASATLCEHGYQLTSSCPICDAA